MDPFKPLDKTLRITSDEAQFTSLTSLYIWNMNKEVFDPLDDEYEELQEMIEEAVEWGEKVPSEVEKEMYELLYDLAGEDERGNINLSSDMKDRIKQVILKARNDG